MADEEDMGTSFMRQHRSEAALSREPGALKGPRNRATPGTDSYYENRYGGGDKSLMMDPGPVQEPNRGRKGNKG